MAVLGGTASGAGDGGLVGATIGHYRVVALIGRGGMGVVYRAEDTRLGRSVALKVLPPELAADRDRRARLLREARSAAAVNHPSLATVHDVGEDGGRVYLAMELIEGTTLRARIREGAIGRTEALRIAKQVAAGLARAHARGIVHRDLKPENVMLTSEGGVKILDFGLAKLREPAPGDEATEAQETETGQGVVMGTPGYMSPEQAAGRVVDARTDVYALGVVVHEMVTGELPGIGGAGKAVADARLAAVVARCLSREPERRWPDGGALLAELEALGERGERRPRVAVVAGVAGVAVMAALGAGVWASTRAPSLPSSESPAAQAAPSASAPAAPSATTYTDLPLPTTQVPEARAELLAGLQAMRDDSWTLAIPHFRHVVQLDPSLALGHLRLAWVLSMLSPDVGRAELMKAVALRSQLSERDQSFLDALQPLFGLDRKDFALSAERFQAASKRWPLDVELLDQVALTTADLTEAVAAEKRAIALDPGDGQAYEVLGHTLAVLGRDEEARAALEKGASVAIGSGDVLMWLGGFDMSRGRCVDYERDAQRMLDVDEANGSYFLAEARLALGRPEAGVRELLVRSAATLPSDVALQGRRNDASLAAAEGRFDLLGPSLDRLARSIAQASPTDYGQQRWLALVRAHRALELGDVSQAHAVATDFVTRSTAWTHGWFLRVAGAVDLSWWMARLAADGPAALDSRRAAWVDEQLQGGVLPGLVWAFAYAAPAQDELEARSALDALARDSRLRLPTPGEAVLTNDLGIPDAYAGHVLLLAGRAADAVPYLERATRRCDVLTFPFEGMHAALDLGRAREAIGDAGGACAAYGRILARWGGAKPRSATADAARSASLRLRCGR